eukprot:6188422-Pleurochrysis_carterae.AAC.4
MRRYSCPDSVCAQWMRCVASFLNAFIIAYSPGPLSLGAELPVLAASVRSESLLKERDTALSEANDLATKATSLMHRFKSENRELSRKCRALERRDSELSVGLSSLGAPATLATRCAPRAAWAAASAGDASTSNGGSVADEGAGCRGGEHGPDGASVREKALLHELGRQREEIDELRAEVRAVRSRGEAASDEARRAQAQLAEQAAAHAAESAAAQRHELAELKAKREELDAIRDAMATARQQAASQMQASRGCALTIRPASAI